MIKGKLFRQILDKFMTSPVSQEARVQVVLPNGDIIKTGARTKKTSAGYNLTNLFIGS